MEDLRSEFDDTVKLLLETTRDLCQQLQDASLELVEVEKLGSAIRLISSAVDNVALTRQRCFPEPQPSSEKDMKTSQ